jgi:hypothetical protein
VLGLLDRIITETARKFSQNIRINNIKMCKNEILGGQLSAAAKILTSAGFKEFSPE